MKRPQFSTHPVWSLQTIRTALILAASLLFITPPFTTPVQSADKPGEAPASPGQKLIGGWEGGPCEGDWIYRPDGTFQARSYSPGGNRLAGTWEVKMDALPPTLVRTCKTSDDSGLVGKTWEVKLVQLDDKALACQEARGHPPHAFTRLSPSDLAKEEAYEEARETELAALQGTWIPLQYEEGGKKVEGDLSTRHIIKGDRLMVQVDGRTQAEGRVVLDASQNPKQLYLHLNSGPTHAIIYVRVGDYVIYCGNRRQEPLPSEFASGTPKGGEYLMAWKIQR
jgi:uncharacterized protein (TIGR03067 family)